MGHTAGPWVLYGEFNINGGPDGRRGVATAGGYQNNRLPDSGDAENRANARLIAAAPDLLLAVKCLCEEMADYMAINNLGDPNEKHNYRLGMAAIAKAELSPDPSPGIS